MAKSNLVETQEYETLAGEKLYSIAMAFTLALIDFFLRANKKNFNHDADNLFDRDGWQHFSNFAQSAKLFYSNLLNNPSYRDIVAYELEAPNPRIKNEWNKLSEEEKEQLFSLLQTLEKEL